MLKLNQIEKLNMWYIKTKFIVYMTMYLHDSVSKNENPFPRTSFFGQSLNHHQHDSKLNKNSKFKPPMSDDQSLSLMFCSSKTM